MLDNAMSRAPREHLIALGRDGMAQVLRALPVPVDRLPGSITVMMTS